MPSTLKYLGFYSFHDCNNIKSIICEANTPPIIIEAYQDKEERSLKAFTETTYEHTILEVPSESLSKYNKAYEWNEFKNIRTSNIDPIAIDTDIEESLDVYNLNGVKVASSLDTLPAGIYIIHLGGKTTKISIK